MLLDAVTGHDPLHDSTSVKTLFEGSLRANLNADVKGLKIGLPKEYFGEGISDAVRKNVMAAAEAYKALGAEVFEISLPLVEYALPIYYILSSAEASSNLARFDGVKYGYRTPNAGDDIIELYTKSRSEGFGAEVQRRIMLHLRSVLRLLRCVLQEGSCRTAQDPRGVCKRIREVRRHPDAGCADHRLRDRLQDHQSARDVRRRYLHGFRQYRRSARSSSAVRF